MADTLKKGGYYDTPFWGKITNPDGTDVPLGTIEDLWNLLKNNSNHKTTNEELGILGF